MFFFNINILNTYSTYTGHPAVDCLISGFSGGHFLSEEEVNFVISRVIIIRDHHRTNKLGLWDKRQRKSVSVQLMIKMSHVHCLAMGSSYRQTDFINHQRETVVLQQQEVKVVVEKSHQWLSNKTFWTIVRYVLSFSNRFKICASIYLYFKKW